MDRIKDIKNNKKIVISLVVILFVLLAIILKVSFAVLTPIKSVIITSEKVSYEEKEPGAWQVEKSAKDR